MTKSRLGLMMPECFF